MSLPNLSGTGRLTADPELRISPNGVSVTKVSLAFNSRKKTDDGKWIDDQVFYIRGVVFRDQAEHVAESLAKGDLVVVSGRLSTRQWTATDESGAESKQSMPELLIDSIGPSLQFANAKVRKMARTSGTGGVPAEEDPFVTASASPATDNPPF